LAFETGQDLSKVVKMQILSYNFCLLPMLINRQPTFSVEQFLIRSEMIG